MGTVALPEMKRFRYDDSFAAAGALLIAAVRGRLDWQLFHSALHETVIFSGVIFLILIGANVFGYFLTLSQIPELLTGWAAGTHVEPRLVLLAIIGIYIVLGCFLEGMAIMVLTLPVVFPVVTGLGFDPIWFGIIIVLVMEMSLITPPVGMNVFLIAGIAGNIPTGKIYRGIFPFWIAMLVCILLLILFPQLALLFARV